MAYQTIPITQTWGPAEVDISALDINQLGTLIAAHLAGSIRADVSFYLEVLFDPTSQVAGVNLIFNATQRVFKAWNTDVGRYVPLTQYQNGDVKNSFVGTDQLSVGWVLLDGRAINAIPGLTASQQTVLQTFFPSGILPAVVPSNTSSLPGANAFSDISKPTVTPSAIAPADGVIAALPFTDPPTGPEYEALRDATETLRDSTQELRTSTAAVETQVAAIQDKASELLAALRNSTTPQLYTLMFVGYT